jgi:hypothetical protein
MAKAVSTIVSIFLLMAADRMAVNLKRKDLLPDEDRLRPEQLAANETHRPFSPVPFFSESELMP